MFRLIDSFARRDGALLSSSMSYLCTTSAWWGLICWEMPLKTLIVVLGILINRFIPSMNINYVNFIPYVVNIVCNGWPAGFLCWTVAAPVLLLIMPEALAVSSLDDTASGGAARSGCSRPRAVADFTSRCWTLKLLDDPSFSPPPAGVLNVIFLLALNFSAAY